MRCARPPAIEMSARLGRLLTALMLAVALAVAGCAPKPPPEPPPPVEPAPEVAPPPRAPERSATTHLDRFCGALQRIVDAEASGFQGLRAERVGPTAWRGAVVPEGLSTCTVEGESNPGAQYVCSGTRARRGNEVTVSDAFRRIGADLDACFARAVWFPRNWQRGELIEFAGVEQQQVWRDLTPTPRPVVALNIDEDILNRIYSIRMAVSTFR